MQFIENITMLQETYIKFTESANARAKELFKREDEIKSLKNEYYTRKENCATPVKECDDHDSSYPPTKVK